MDVLGGLGIFGLISIVFAIWVAWSCVKVVPQGYNFTVENFGRYEKTRHQQIAAAHARKTQIKESQAPEAIGALIATIVAIIVGVAAYLAGRTQTPLAFENFYGLVLCALVIGVFTVITFLEALSETAWVQALARHMRALSRRVQFLADFYEWLDECLARVGAGVAGMGQRKVGARYLILAGSLICLCVLAWYLPAPLGLLPAFVGLVIAVSVSRLWAWVESDRALAAMTEYRLNAPYRVGFREDFRDEAMLAFAFVFILLPIAMMQAHTGRVFGETLFDGAEHRSFLDWFGFFGVELAKAIPIVNWSEVYNIRDGPDVIGFSSEPARHMVFLARVTIDMVLIAALLQALAISERNRNQKRLFAAGHIRRFDELVERSEIGRAARATWIGGQPACAFDLTKLGKDDVVDFRRYDPVRLKTIYWSSKHSLVRDFIMEISAASAGGVNLSTAMDLTRDIADSTKDPAEMTQAFARALEEHHRAVRLIDIDDIYNVLFDLRRVPGLRDFKFNVIDKTIKLIEPQIALVRLSDFAGGALADFQYVRRHIASLAPALAAGVHSAAIIEDVCILWESWSYEEQPHGPEYDAALRALKRRLKILRNKKS